MIALAAGVATRHRCDPSVGSNRGSDRFTHVAHELPDLSRDSVRTLAASLEAVPGTQHLMDSGYRQEVAGDVEFTRRCGSTAVTGRERSWAASEQTSFFDGALLVTADARTQPTAAIATPWSASRTRFAGSWPRCLQPAPLAR